MGSSQLRQAVQGRWASIGEFEFQANEFSQRMGSGKGWPALVNSRMSKDDLNYHLASSCVKQELSDPPCSSAKDIVLPFGMTARIRRDLRSTSRVVCLMPSCDTIPS